MSGRLSNASQSDLLKLLFQNVAWANVGNTAGLQPSSAPGNFYIALHTADPGAAGNQHTSEANYTSYARQGVARSSAGWVISGSSPTAATNAAVIAFPACTGGSETETWFSLGVDVSSLTGEALFQGPLTASLAVSSGITPSFAIGALTCTMD